MARKLLIVTHDLVGQKMAGPAIRCWELARQLCGTLEVTLTSKLPVERSHPDFRVTTFADDAALIAQAAEADILLLQGFMLRHHPRLGTLGKYLVIDLYDPFILESYPHYASLGPARDATYLESVYALDEQMLLGDYFLCASERQRDMWLGRFCALARLTPELFGQDPSMGRLLGLVPFGLPDAPPETAKPVLKGVVPGIHEDDFVLLWGGGVWNWFDPLTVIRAVAAIGETRQDVKLYFLGMKHPNPEIPEMAMASEAIALATELGVKDRLVFFNHDWVDYEARQGYLAESDAGVSAHFDSLETRFSFRTRVLDYFWAGLPVLTTEGDGMAELVAKDGLGEVIPYQDVAGWQRAILALVEDRDRATAVAARVTAFSERFRWSRVVGPLAAYCQAPYHTPKSLKPTPDAVQVVPAAGAAPSLFEKGLRVFRQEGAGVLVKKGLGYVRKRSDALRAGRG